MEIGNSYIHFFFFFFVIHILCSFHSWCFECWRRVVVGEEMVETVAGLVCCDEELDSIF